MRVALCSILVTTLCVVCGGTGGPAPEATVVAIVPPSPSPTAVAWPTIAAPSGAPAGEWVALPAPGGKTVPAAVFRPAGAGPFPAVVFLHGDPGMTTKELNFAARFAADGFITLAACWYKTRGQYAGRVGQPSGFFDCADAPDWVGNRTEALDASLEAPTIASIVDAVRRLPGIRPGSVAVIGHSAGSRAAIEMASTGGHVEAVVALAGGYDPSRRTRAGPLAGARAGLTPLVGGLGAPLLIVHGTADTTVPVSEARTYEAAARAHGKTVEAIYVEGGSHTFLYVLSDEVRGQVVTFLRSQLGR